MVPNTYTLQAVAELANLAGEYWLALLFLGFGVFGVKLCLKGCARWIAEHYGRRPNNHLKP